MPIKSINDAMAQRPPYIPENDEREYITRVYSDFIYDYQIKNQEWEILNNRSLQQFWKDSNRDYNNIVIDDPFDPIQQYTSGITRDKANTFITNLTMQLLSPSVIAQNENQEIDHIISRVGRPILDWQYSNDGRPSESGELKNSRYIHKMVNEGTVHVQDDIDPKTGRLISSVIPNEEVFVPNFYQPNVQLQSHFIRLTNFASYQESEAEFGMLENFKYVQPGNLGWLNTVQLFKEKFKAIVVANQVSVVRAWYPVPEDDLEKLKKSGKLPSYVTMAKYFNIVINGVLMFPPDNLMPYYHGAYPVNKGVFEYFSPSEFYWGNSVPNKCRQDKKFKDGWMTLIRYKAKLGALKPMYNATGQNISGDVLTPANIVTLPANTDMKKFGIFEGISDGINNGDIQIMAETEKEIERATVSPQVAGQKSQGEQTARETIIIEQNAQKAMMGLAQQIAFLQEARSFPILKSSFQFITRTTLKKIAIPEQTLDNGETGTLEVVFTRLPKMTPQESLAYSYHLLHWQNVSKKNGHNKKIIEIDEEYIHSLELYCKATAESLPKASAAIRQASAEAKWQLYSQHGDIFNLKNAAKKLVRENGDDETDMINENTPQMPMFMEQNPTEPTATNFKKAMTKPNNSLSLNQSI